MRIGIYGGATGFNEAPIHESGKLGIGNGLAAHAARLQ